MTNFSNSNLKQHYVNYVFNWLKCSLQTDTLKRIISTAHGQKFKVTRKYSGQQSNHCHYTVVQLFSTSGASEHHAVNRGSGEWFVFVVVMYIATYFLM